MTTTAVLAEMRVGGIQALIWVVLIALSIAQPSQKHAYAILALKDWAVPATPVLVAIAYALGIVVDRIADSTFKHIFGKSSDPADLRLQVLARGDKVTDFLEYIRSRIRVSRVATLNLFVITIAAGFALRLCTRASWYQTIAALIMLTVLTVCSLYTTLRIGETYEARLRQAAALPPPVKKS